MKILNKFRRLALAGLLAGGLVGAVSSPANNPPAPTCTTNWCELAQCLSPAYETFSGIYLWPGTNFCRGSEVYAQPEPYPYSQFCGTARVVIVSSPPGKNCPPDYRTNSFCPMSKTNWSEVIGPNLHLVAPNQLWIWFTPTNCGDYTVTFHEVWTNPPPCGYGATCGSGGSISISTNFTVMKVDIAETERIVCAGGTTSFTLTNSCGPVTWELDPPAGPGDPQISGGVVTTGTNCGSWTVIARSTVNANCSDSATLNVVALQAIVDGSGNPISSANGNNVAMVGQHINLSAQTCGGTFSNFQWTVPGYAISSYDVSTATLVTNFPVTNSTVNFYWVDGGSKQVSCSAECGGIICSTNATISVTRPTVTMHDSNTGTWYAYGGIAWRISLSFGDISTHADDMQFHVEINSPTSGYGEYVQVINSYFVNSQQLASNEADNVVPYNGQFFLVAGGGSNALLGLDDGPAASAFGSVSLTASYTDYVMYQPRIENTVFAPLGGDTIYVPLGKVTWGIDGGAHWSGLSIIIDPADQTGPDGPDSSTAFPSWVDIFHNQ